MSVNAKNSAIMFGIILHLDLLDRAYDFSTTLPPKPDFHDSWPIARAIEFHQRSCISTTSHLNLPPVPSISNAVPPTLPMHLAFTPKIFACASTFGLSVLATEITIRPCVSPNNKASNRLAAALGAAGGTESIVSAGVPDF